MVVSEISIKHTHTYTRLPAKDATDFVTLFKLN